MRSRTFPGSMVRVPDELDELGEEPAHRCRTAVQVGMAEKQLVAGQVAVGDTDIADVPTRPGGADGLQHRLTGADRLDDGVGTETRGEALDSGCAFVAAFFDGVRGSG